MTESNQGVQGIVLAHQTDWDGFRAATRAHVLAGTPPERLAWSVGAPDDLLATDQKLPHASGTFNLPRPLVELAQAVILARDPERFALLHGLIFRAHAGERTLLEQTTDPAVQRATRLAQHVRRDMHKMRAFVRFRAVAQDGVPRYVAWFEPDHYIAEANAPFFARRFATMVWSILTPDTSVHWDGTALAAGPGAERRDIPDDDALETYWRAYFGAIFNPARLKVGAMLSEMPRKYWRNLPEAAAIPDLIRSATAATEAMLERDMRDAPHPPKPPSIPLGPQPLAPTRAAAAETGPTHPGSPLAERATEAASCRRCHLWEPATQTVFGEGPADATIMFVGEQPGDQEDLAGRPFVGPAGQVLDRALDEAGIDRRAVYVTNAVKHFKFEPRGKRRIHSKPDTVEILACAHWLREEREIIRPRLTVLLGATAARAVLGRTVTIGRERGRPIPLGAAEGGGTAMVTVHPSYLLRLPDEAAKESEYRAFVADLRAARAVLAA